MPAWMAGIQMRRMRPETSTSAWIPALHAGNDGIEESYRKLTEALYPRIFYGEHDGHYGNMGALR